MEIFNFVRNLLKKEEQMQEEVVQEKINAEKAQKIVESKSGPVVALLQKEGKEKVSVIIKEFENLRKDIIKLKDASIEITSPKSQRILQSTSSIKENFCSSSLDNFENIQMPSNINFDSMKKFYDNCEIVYAKVNVVGPKEKSLLLFGFERETDIIIDQLREVGSLLKMFKLFLEKDCAQMKNYEEFNILIQKFKKSETEFEKNSKDVLEMTLLIEGMDELKQKEKEKLNSLLSPIEREEIDNIRKNITESEEKIGNITKKLEHEFSNCSKPLKKIAHYLNTEGTVGKSDLSQFIDYTIDPVLILAKENPLPIPEFTSLVESSFNSAGLDEKSVEKVEEFIKFMKSFSVQDIQKEYLELTVKIGELRKALENKVSKCSEIARPCQEKISEIENDKKEMEKNLVKMKLINDNTKEQNREMRIVIEKLIYTLTSKRVSV